MHYVNKAHSHDHAVDLKCVFNSIIEVSNDFSLRKVRIADWSLDQIYQAERHEVYGTSTSEPQKLLAFFSKLKSVHIFKLHQGIIFTYYCRKSKVFYLKTSGQF